MDSTTLVNYCPVLNLLLLSKEVEGLVAGQLQAFLDDESIFNPLLSSFYLGHGMETVLVVTLTDDLQTHLYLGRSALLLLLDLTAAFDMVDYVLMTYHLANIKVWGTPLQWFSPFLGGLRIVLIEEISLCYPM